MGKPKKRVSPRIANRVNRDFERLIFLCILGAVRAASAPWECNLPEIIRRVVILVYIDFWDETGFW
ncbi:hypothetical protein CW714_05270 [Methanophagales archaeon]|nr:MAG: hypothetical protein CW714_05270 [Methanophagales archaeon]